MKKWILIGFLISTAIIGKAQDTTRIIDVTPGEFLMFMDSLPNSLLLDTRERFLYNKQRITGSICVPSMGTLDSLTDSLDLDTPLLVYCEIGKRSKTVCNQLQKKGFTTVVNLEKGIRQWKKEGFDVDDDKISK